MLRIPDQIKTMAVLIVFALLAGCGSRAVVMYAERHPDAQTKVMYVVTQRALGQANDNFGEERNFGLNQFRAEVSIPPTHEVGEIEWPSGTPNAATDFVITDSRLLRSKAEMMRNLNAERVGGETMMYVHGYNNSLSEAMYRFAQIKTDFEVPGPSVLFSWQSAGDPRGYVYDRDSVLFARDDLVQTIRTVSAGDGHSVWLMAHSMGAQLTMEALRQIALSGQRDLLNRVSGVVLISPDIDPDLFRSQVEAIGELPTPIAIFVSHTDRALGLASLITGRKERLGVIDSPRHVEGLDVRVVDFTALSDGENGGHLVPVTAPGAVKVLRGLIAQQKAGQKPFGTYLVLEADIADR